MNFLKDSARKALSQNEAFNFTDIEDLCISEIVENRDFKLLEKNLSSVANVNLEEEYDLKVVDQNLVKLLRLAQLGISYLSFRESYLTNCIILLQKNLMVFQKECQSSYKRDVSLIHKRKNKKLIDPHFKCDKCEKIFITEMYLKCHKKRRHSKFFKKENPNHSLDPCLKPTDKFDLRHSVQTQTQWDESDNELKIKKLEKELEVLKKRVAAAEKYLIEKSNENSEVPVLPRTPFSLAVASLPSVEKQPFPQSSSENNHERLENIKSTEVHKTFGETEIIGQDRETVIHKGLLQQKREIVESSVRKSNDPLQNSVASEVVEVNFNPRPYPRKVKKKISVEVTKMQEMPQQQSETNEFFLHKDQPPNETSFVCEIEDKGEKEVIITNKSKSQIQTAVSLENKVTSAELTSGSLIKKIGKGSSPRITKLKNNLKKSLTNLYESVLLNGKDIKEDSSGIGRDVVAKLSGTAETSFFSKDTIRHKVKEVVEKQRRNLKEISLHKNEEHKRNFFKKFGRSNFTIFREKSLLNVKKEDEKDVDDVEEDDMKGNKTKRSKMYDLEVESQLDSSSIMEVIPAKDEAEDKYEISKRNSVAEPVENHQDPAFEKEFDYSIFQVGNSIKQSIVTRSLNETFKHSHVNSTREEESDDD